MLFLFFLKFTRAHSRDNTTRGLRKGNKTFSLTTPTPTQKNKTNTLPIVLALPHPTNLIVAKMAQNGATDPNTANEQAGAPEFAKGKGKAVEEHEDTSMVEDDDEEEEDEEVEEVIAFVPCCRTPAFPPSPANDRF